ncbi:phosphatidylserine decarboxylase [Planococcus antarcticus DSM 14505]|uniref:phosphatidylserine decarboxylase n=1 Tax=Planococcus antarcticus DSM 14505 TaxID=1185653 RepID=A0A1C7DIM6_9BACL|nr:phosphatidylserine decarboxylase [Planococcus antarcticus]ANU11262.1 phosphatidylserine decarboxylase [Planococcus antarcticus DSM 14505]EIM07896.1 phosphatidylserine decarboxylase [Planococcus antarcticus DSM 14505]
MKKYLYQRSIELTNGAFTSALIRQFAQSKNSRRFIPGYIKAYQILVDEVEEPVDSFPTLHDFFVRKLSDTSRPIADVPVVSPVDGKIEIAGDLQEGARFLVKGQEYSLVDLLGDDALADRYQGGTYAVLYLSPADYHRIHSPADGKVTKQYVLGKKSYPVNAAGLQYGKAPISGNYRMITELETIFGMMLVVKVGAMFVNSIKLTETGSDWQKGYEVGYFSFGSTVVLFFEENSIKFVEDMSVGRSIKVGEALGNMI